MAKKNHKTFKRKLVEGLLTLGGFFGLLSITDLKIPLSIWSIMVISVILIIIIFHTMELYRKIKTYFDDLRKDINYIKNKIKKNGGKNA